MSTRKHVTVSGHHIEYTASPKLQAFLDRVAKLVTDPKVTEQNLIGLAYSHENPMLDSTLHPSRGIVTKAVLDDPAYGVLTDLLFRKRVAQEGLSVEKIAERYSMTVGEAAAQLEVTEGAIRQAIAAKRLASWIKEGGRHYVDPRSLKTLEVGTRRPTGPRAVAVGGPLEVKTGNRTGASFSVRAPVDVKEGTIPTWKRVVVRSTGVRGSKRAWVLVPSVHENEISHVGFFVRGHFAIEATTSNPKKADDLWQGTQAE